MRILNSHTRHGGIAHLVLGCVGDVCSTEDFCMSIMRPSLVRGTWLVVKYDVHNRENVYIVPFQATEEYVSHPATDDHLVYGGHNGNRVFLMNRATFVPVAQIGQCEVIKQDYPAARMLQKYLSDLVTGPLLCEVKESAPPRLRGGSVLEEDE
jgi:hypothetical protein